MAFVTLEDLQGEIELVVFPRTWEQSNDLIAIDRIILAEGRVDTQSNLAKVLVDRLTIDLKVTSTMNPVARVLPPALLNGDTAPLYTPETASDLDSLRVDEDDQPGLPADNGNGRAGVSESLPPGESTAFFQNSSPTESLPAVEEPYSDEYDLAEDWLEDLEDGWEKSAPPPPELFPPDWELASAVFDAVAHPSDSIALANTSSDVEAQLADPSPKAASPQAELTLPAAQPEELSPADLPATSLPASDIAAPEASLPAYILSPIASGDRENLHMITIILRPSNDKIRDNLRIRAIYGTLITYPGNDRFAFQVYEQGRGYLIEFPNFTTGLCQELISRLRLFISPEHLRIEPITIQ
jgi:hypothetical protein